MRAKISDYLLDISKLVFAGVVLSTILDVEGISKLAILAIGLAATVGIAVLGLILIRND